MLVSSSNPGFLTRGRVSPMTVFRFLSTLVLAGAVSVMLAACGTPRGDADVNTEPEEGRSDGPGLFTGKKGGIVVDVEVWTGASPYGDSAE